MAYPATVPPEVCGLELLDRIDYDDAYVAPTSQDIPLAEWGRLLLRAAPRPMLVFAWLVQRYALGLVLRAPSRDQPMGSWTVLDRGPDTYVLAADGPLARARLVGFKTDDGVGVTTMMTLDSRRARVSWTLISPVHRAFLRNFLDRATAQAAKPQSADGT